MSEDEARSLEAHLAQEFRGYGYYIEAELLVRGDWGVQIR